MSAVAAVHPDCVQLGGQHAMVPHSGAIQRLACTVELGYYQSSRDHHWSDSTSTPKPNVAVEDIHHVVRSKMGLDMSLKHQELHHLQLHKDQVDW
jgi:uncharacterized protein (DUF1015 family)